MTSQEIRKSFLEYFKSKQHEVVPSAPMVIKNDPTLMFTNAGMNQFKDVFLGNAEAKSPRIANSQKCLRVSGKHNDLEEVGVDTYHHTMFEMLGNWSFGNYFKKEAIEWAWDYLTGVLKLDKDRLYVTIFEGAEEDGTGLDQEARDLWSKYIAEDRILACDKKDNFWEMGEIGPCGPCSEIHVDMRSEEERKRLDGKELVNQDHPQVIEVWNLVFMEYNRMSDKSLRPLPHKHVDTGMGLERLVMVMQGKQSNYDTDLFQPLIGDLEKLSGFKYGEDHNRDIAFRVISDHVRTLAFAIADCQLPANTGAGYVIRRILRRAVRYGYSFLGQKQSFMHKLMPVLISLMGEQYPELKEQEEFISNVIREEEEGFLKTLEKGILRFEEYLKKGAALIEGDFAFELYDTFGFPIDLTELLARERELAVDMEAFKACLKVQKDRSRAASKMEAGDWIELYEDDREEFIGYDYTEADVKITAYRQVKVKGKEFFQLIFNMTPFYPEGGGQVGDTGFIESEGKKTGIFDTKKENNQILHFVKELPENLKGSFHAVVSQEKRQLSMNNHSATHLLHKALREVLGAHVEQKGSLVSPEHLRFDFSHFSKVDGEQIEQIEALVNARIRANYALEEKRDIPVQQALDLGAMALFGEKYGDVVRVIKFGESIELCGGTHVAATGNIGAFKIVSESSVAAGIRRIEAYTSVKADAYYKEQEEVLHQVKVLLKGPKDVAKALQALVEENTRLNKEVESLNREKAKVVKSELLSKFEDIAGVDFLSARLDISPQQIKDIAFQLKSQKENIFMVLGTDHGGKPNLTVMVSEGLVENKKLNAGQIVRELAVEIQGGGGGQAFFATAGGKNLEGLDKAIAKAKDYLN